MHIVAALARENPSEPRRACENHEYQPWASNTRLRQRPETSRYFACAPRPAPQQYEYSQSRTLPSATLALAVDWPTNDCGHKRLAGVGAGSDRAAPGARLVPRSAVSG